MYKKKKIDLVLWVFGLIALAITLAVAILIFLLYARVHGSENLNSVQDATSNLADSVVQEEMKQEYQQVATDILSQSRSADDSLSELLSQAEARLLALRVPAEYKDRHLQAVLAIARLRTELATSPDSADKTELINILSALIEE